MRAHVILLLLSAPWFGACGDLPRPFQHDGATNPLLEIKAPAGIFVQPVTGDRPQTEGAVAGAMASALQRLDVPASTLSRNTSSMTLHGHVQVVAAEENERLSVLWELRDAKGGIAGIHRSEGQLPAGLWDSAHPDVLAQLAEEAAPKIAAMVQDPVAQIDPPRAAVSPLDLAILPLLGGLDDPQDHLGRALTQELRLTGYPVVEAGGEEVLMIQGLADLSPTQDGEQLLTLVWTLRQAEDGSEVGQIEQQSLVSHDALTRDWVQTARQISIGAAAGIHQVIEQASQDL
ncbi:MAG: hypothetical protein AAF530_04205 [Pseudomonadota bacterium]